MTKNKIKLGIIIVLLATFLISSKSSALNTKNEYPKLANYFLKWTIEDYEVEELAKWDLLVLDMEVQENSRENLKKIKQLNPDIIILAYITSEEANADIYNSEWSYNATLRKRLFDGIDNGWWLRDSSSNRISFWPGTYMLNLSDGAKTNSQGKRWNDYLPEFVKNEIISTGLWNGVMYDNIWGDVAWVNGKISLENNGQTKSINETNTAWANGTKKMLQKTRQLLGNDFLILGNGKVYLGYQDVLNGVLFESFPASWESNGDWGQILSTYSNIEKMNKTPNATIVNSYDSNRTNYQKVRFGLGSTMLQSSGYFSFDFDVSSHNQTWWYDEYDADLGKALSSAYNLLDKNSSTYKKGLWRRDFEKGIILVNSTDSEQTYIFKNEEFEKINGTQDRSVNNGSVINYIKIKSKDGVILFKKASIVSTIRNSSFNNGDFIRVFNRSGNQSKSGFFAYLDKYPANSQILVSDIDNDAQDETLVNSRGIITIYKNGSKIREFKPYDGLFKGEISFAVADLNGDGTREIITGAGAGGGPHVRIFSKEGKLLTGGFFAYDKNFRGGVKVAVMDLDGDGTQEVITAAGSGGGPHIRVFTKDGRSLTAGFFAYDQKFKGGVAITVGDVNGDGEKEIITAPGVGSKPEVKIFTKDGKFISSFLAYESTFTSGLRVMCDDIEGDGTYEILTGTLNF